MRRRKAAAVRHRALIRAWLGASLRKCQLGEAGAALICSTRGLRDSFSQDKREQRERKERDKGRMKPAREEGGKLKSSTLKSIGA